MTKVLVVDDDQAFRRSLTRSLASHGYECFEASGGDAALEVLVAEPDIAAVLCDIRMPEHSGIDLLARLTADHPDAAVVMMTAVDDPDVADAAFESGAYGYIVKPFDTNELLINLASALKRRSLEATHRGHVRSLERAIVRTRMLREIVGYLDDAHDRNADGDADMVERLARAIGLPRDETAAHIERMSRYSVVLAQAVGYDRLTSDDLRRIAALHDVGKIGVPSEILLKAGGLTLVERSVMQPHARIGFQLLGGGSGELQQVAAQIALTHHEWWDGSGYPRGLRGTEIADEARIVAVADVFDALTSDRSHRAAMSFDEAMALMRQLRGRQFEPSLLDAFFDVIDDVEAIHHDFPDDDGTLLPIRVLVVDADALSRQAVVARLESQPGLKVVALAESVSETVVSAFASEPDVILMDFQLAEGDGLQAIAQIRALTPSVQVIMLTLEPADEALVGAIGAGCAGFVKKTADAGALLEAIEAAHEGDLVTMTVDLAPLLRQLPPTHRGLGSDVTPRELEILTLMAGGAVNKQIAAELGLRLNTVRNHVQSILSKLDAHSKLEAVATAVREGVVGYPDPA
jgi:putative two-component system response regulator